MQIFVKLLKGENLTIEVQPNDSIQSVKKKIEQRTGIPKDQLILIFGGYRLESGKSLSDYKIQQQHTINLVSRLRGGCQFNFNSLQNKKELNFGKGPYYRTVSPGLTLLAICQTDSCEAFDYQVCIQKGFGTFQIGKEIFKCVCPCCKKPTRESTNLGYYQTYIKFQGRQKSGQQIYREERVQNGKFTTFRNTDGDIRSWNYLEITTTPLK